MRKGDERRDWNTKEVEYLKSAAGTKPASDIGADLSRSTEAIYSKARHMRAEGETISLKAFESKLRTCHRCGYMRYHVNREGVCRVCLRREQLQDIEWQVGELMDLLTPEQRAIYEETESMRESRFDPLPRPPEVPNGTTEYRRSAALERWTIEAEEVLIANIDRQKKAAQKRKERIQKKVRNQCQIGTEGQEIAADHNSETR